MMSFFLFIAFAGSASAFTVAPSQSSGANQVAFRNRINMLSGLEAKSASPANFECGVCGGASDWCPVCRGPAAPPLMAVEEAVESKAGFECGVCGGASDWCPVCRGPSAGSFEALDFSSA